MPSWKPFCTALHLTALGLWAGSIAIAAATAAVAFPTLKNMHIRVPGIQPAFEEEGFRFAAGAVAQKVFLIADMVSFACAIAAVTTLLALLLLGAIAPRRPSTYIRGLALGIALAALASNLLVVTPRIISASKLHLQAAQSGDAPAAAAARLVIDDAHPLAANLLAAELIGALVALFLGAWAAGDAPSSPVPPPGSHSAAYPEPDLLKRKRA